MPWESGAHHWYCECWRPTNHALRHSIRWWSATLVVAGQACLRTARPCRALAQLRAFDSRRALGAESGSAGPLWVASAAGKHKERDAAHLCWFFALFLRASQEFVKHSGAEPKARESVALATSHRQEIIPTAVTMATRQRQESVTHHCTTRQVEVTPGVNAAQLFAPLWPVPSPRCRIPTLPVPRILTRFTAAPNSSSTPTVLCHTPATKPFSGCACSAVHHLFKKGSLADACCAAARVARRHTQQRERASCGRGSYLANARAVADVPFPCTSASRVQ